MRADVASILIAMGYNSLTDFSASDPGDGNVRVDWYAQTAMPTAAQIDAAAPTAAQTVATRFAQAQKAAAVAGIDSGQLINGDKLERLTRAVALVALDAFNTDRACMSAMNTAVQGAATLAALKTAFAAISYPPQVTGAQLVNAIKAKIAVTAE